MVKIKGGEYNGMEKEVMMEDRGKLQHFDPFDDAVATPLKKARHLVWHF